MTTEIKEASFEEITDKKEEEVIRIDYDARKESYERDKKVKCHTVV
jgi:hypothetical protein